MPKTVETVLGPVPVDELGVTDYHEHLYAEPPRWYVEQYPDFLLNDVDRAVEELNGVGAAGLQTLVEMTAIDYGRRPAKLVEIARRSNVHVIATTGFNKPLYCDRWVEWLPEERLVDILVQDLTVGMEDTGAKAGVIKAGTAYNVASGLGEKLLRVGARASAATGAHMITHTENGTMAVEQLELLAGEGVPLTHICISHMDRNPDLGYHREIAQAGAFLGYDCAGKIKYAPDSVRIALIREMVESELGGKILLGNDYARRSYMRSYGGGPGMDFLLAKFLPRLERELGNNSLTELFMVKNPRHFFGDD